MILKAILFRSQPKILMETNLLSRTWQFIKQILQAVFSPEDEIKIPWLTVIWIGALVLAGAILWGIFFNWGDVPFNYMDWAEVWAPRMQAWRDALLNNTLPFHLSDRSALRTANDRYFSVPDMVSSPQVVLLRWLEVGVYAFVNNLILYGVATYFLLLIRKKYSLSLYAFTVLFLIFHFNGFIVTHLSIGHLSWGGYYLFPPFILLLLEMVEGDRSWRWVTRMALVLFFIWMQGSFHHLVWCLICLGVLAIVRWRYFPQLLKAGAFGLLLSTPRLLPAALVELNKGSRGIDFLGGYPSVGNLLYSLVYNSTPDMGWPGLVFESSLGYWEFDVFVGWAGLLFLAVFGIGSTVFCHYRRKEVPALLVPVLVLGILSINDNYLKVLFYQPVLVSSERVTSRMFGLALVTLLILTGINYQKTVRLIRQHFLVQILQIVLLLMLISELLLHTLRWSVKNASLAFAADFRDLSRIHVSNHADPDYFWALGIGMVVSGLCMAFLFWKTRQHSAGGKQNT